jgi:hypothetical protein
LVYGQAVLTEVAGSAHPPQVAILEPRAGDYSGAIDVRWSANDSDGEDLRIAIYLSADDGETWIPLAIEVPDSRYALDTEAHPNCDQCRIRVVAHDGFHGTAADSDTFRVHNEPRVVWEWPTDGSQDAPAFTKLRAVFRDPMQAQTIDEASFTVVDDQGSPVAGRVSYDADTSEAVFSPDAPLRYRGTYMAGLSRSILDRFGQPLLEDHVWSFTVERSPVAPACAGDCDGDGRVRINELVLGVNIALGRLPLGSCLSVDPDGDGSVRINELILSVGHALRGCPGSAPTPTPTRAPTVTRTPQYTGTVSPSPTVTP